MATSLTSDIYHEYSCTPCRDDNENREAEIYCVNCMDYLCKKCFKYHNRLTGTRDHHLLSKDEFQQVSTLSTSSVSLDLPTERCLRHHGKLVDMFCRDHDVVGCSLCIMKHRLCKDIFYIPDVAKSRVTKQSLETIHNLVNTTHHKATDIRDNRLENQSRIVKEKDNCLEKILSRRTEIDKHLDKLQNVQTTNITDTFNEFNNRLGKYITYCDKTITSIDQSKQNLSTYDLKHNASQTFIHMKQTEQILSKADKDLKEIDAQMNDSLCLHYKTDTDIKDALSSRDLFGRLHAGIPIPADLEFVEDINIKLDSDTDICNCTDICQLTDGTLIVTDSNNKKIKSLTYDTTYKLDDSLTMSNFAWGVCCISDNDVAVTIPDDRKVEIISTKPNMVTKRSFRVHSPCFGIAYCDKRLYIGHNFDKQLTVYNIMGDALKTYKKDQQGKALFSEPRHLFVTQTADKEQIVVADRYKGLVVINMSGQLVTDYTCTYQDRQWIYGVCIDDKGNFILTDVDSREIVLVGVDLTCRTLLTNMDKDPLAVFFDTQTMRLFVAQSRCDFMKVFIPKYILSSPY